MLSKNLAYLRKNKHRTQEDVAVAIGIRRTTYAGYEKGPSEPVASVLTKLADYFEVNVDDLMRRDLDLPLFQQKVQKARLLDTDIRVLPVSVDSQQRENILYVPEAAVAGYLSEHNQPEYIKQLPHFRLPKLNSGTYRAFDIQGDSMPPLHNGYVLIGKFVELAQDFKSGNRYVLVIKDKGIVFKKVMLDSGKRIRPEKDWFILVSDNPEFAPYSIDVTDILEAWEMVAFIGYPNVYQDNTHVLNGRLQVIEQKLNQLNLPS